MTQVVFLQPVEDHTPEQVDAPEGSCDSMERQCWRRLLSTPVTLWNRVHVGTEEDLRREWQRQVAGWMQAS